VSSAEKKTKAEEIARKVDDVKSVVNNLEVKP
jgi:osmotically-inducible protein OsmY